MMHVEDGEEPPSICVPPPVNPALSRYVTAFQHTSRDRPVGMSAGAIPSGAIIGYARDVDGVTDRAELRRYLRFVAAIDDEWLSARRAENFQPNE